MSATGRSWPVICAGLLTPRFLVRGSLNSCRRAKVREHLRYVANSGPFTQPKMAACALTFGRHPSVLPVGFEGLPGSQISFASVRLG
jgi:hypothetical protein